MASEYITAGAQACYNGVFYGNSPGNSSEGVRFDWNSNYFAFTRIDSATSFRLIWNGSFNIKNGVITANKTTYSVFAYHRHGVSQEELGGDTVEGPFELGSSFNIKSEYRSFQGSFDGFGGRFDAK